MRASHFEIVEGDNQSSVILHVPHSAREIPNEIRSQILLTDAELEIELDEMTDSRTDLLASEAAAASQIKPWIFRNTLSRLVIDPERFPDEREEMNAIGMGAVYQKTSSGKWLREKNPERDGDLLGKYFHPYSLALESLVRKVLDKHNRVTIIDVHSYRMEEHFNSLNKGQRRPPVCLGVDFFHTPEWLQKIALTSFSQIGEVVINEPYAGTYVPLAFYGNESRVSSVMMENREDGLVGENINRAIRALHEVVNEIESAR